MEEGRKEAGEGKRFEESGSPAGSASIEEKGKRARASKKEERERAGGSKDEHELSTLCQIAEPLERLLGVL
jgi:hypothetical protein